MQHLLKISHLHIFDASVSITQSSFGMNMFRGFDCLTSVEFVDCSLSYLEHHCLRLPVISQALQCWNPLRSFVTTPGSPLILCSIVGNTIVPSAAILGSSMILSCLALVLCHFYLIFGQQLLKFPSFNLWLLTLECVLAVTHNVSYLLVYITRKKEVQHFPLVSGFWKWFSPFPFPLGMAIFILKPCTEDDHFSLSIFHTLIPSEKCLQPKVSLACFPRAQVRST